jgi:CelD/BcsL family acetyltransferase involved in cellulose biosynthesis
MTGPDQSAAGTVRARTVSDLDELREFEPQWNDLVAQCPTALPMSSYAWVSSYFRHFVEPPDNWVCLMADRGDRLVGVLPLVLHPGGTFVRTARLPQNPHTISVDAVLEPGAAQQVFGALLEAVRELEVKPKAIAFSRVREDSPTHSLVAPGVFRFTEHAENGAYLPVPADFDEYRQSLSRNFRNNLNKARNKLAKLPNVQTTILAGDDADPGLLPRFAAVEAASWKGDIATAIQCSPRLLDFYGDLTRGLHRAGWLEWQFLDTDGHDIAANLCIRLRRSLFVWKLGYDADYSRCSPGGMLLEHVVRQASAEGTIDEIDLTTNQPWYDNWGMSWRPYNDLTAFWKGTLGGTSAYYALKLKDRLRRFPILKRVKGYLSRD